MEPSVSKFENNSKEEEVDWAEKLVKNLMKKDQELTELRDVIELKDAKIEELQKQLDQYFIPKFKEVHIESLDIDQQYNYDEVHKEYIQRNRKSIELDIRSKIEQDIRDSEESIIRSKVINELENEVREELRDDLYEKLQTEVEEQLRNDLEWHLKNKISDDLLEKFEDDWRKEIEEEIRNNFIEDIRKNLEEEIRPELESIIDKEVRDNISEELINQIKKEIEPSLKNDLYKSVREELEEENRKKASQTLIEDVRSIYDTNYEQKLKSAKSKAKKYKKKLENILNEKIILESKLEKQKQDMYVLMREKYSYNTCNHETEINSIKEILSSKETEIKSLEEQISELKNTNKELNKELMINKNQRNNDSFKEKTIKRDTFDDSPFKKEKGKRNLNFQRVSIKPSSEMVFGNENLEFHDNLKIRKNENFKNEKFLYYGNAAFIIFQRCCELISETNFLSKKNYISSLQEKLNESNLLKEFNEKFENDSFVIEKIENGLIALDSSFEFFKEIETSLQPKIALIIKEFISSVASKYEEIKNNLLITINENVDLKKDVEYLCTSLEDSETKMEILNQKLLPLIPIVEYCNNNEIQVSTLLKNLKEYQDSINYLNKENEELKKYNNEKLEINNILSIDLCSLKKELDLLSNENKITKEKFENLIMQSNSKFKEEKECFQKEILKIQHEYNDLNEKITSLSSNLNSNFIDLEKKELKFKEFNSQLEISKKNKTPSKSFDFSEFKNLLESQYEKDKILFVKEEKLKNKQLLGSILQELKKISNKNIKYLKLLKNLKIENIIEYKCNHSIKIKEKINHLDFITNNGLNIIEKNEQNKRNCERIILDLSKMINQKEYFSQLKDLVLKKLKKKKDNSSRSSERRKLIPKEPFKIEGLKLFSNAEIQEIKLQNQKLNAELKSLKQSLKIPNPHLSNDLEKYELKLPQNIVFSKNIQTDFPPIEIIKDENDGLDERVKELESLLIHQNEIIDSENREKSQMQEIIAELEDQVEAGSIEKNQIQEMLFTLNEDYEQLREKYEEVVNSLSKLKSTIPKTDGLIKNQQKIIIPNSPSSIESVKNYKKTSSSHEKSHYNETLQSRASQATDELLRNLEWKDEKSKCVNIIQNFSESEENIKIRKRIQKRFKEIELVLKYIEERLNGFNFNFNAYIFTSNKKNCLEVDQNNRKLGLMIEKLCSKNPVLRVYCETVSNMIETMFIKSYNHQIHILQLTNELIRMKSKPFLSEFSQEGNNFITENYSNFTLVKSFNEIPMVFNSQNAQSKSNFENFLNLYDISMERISKNLNSFNNTLYEEKCSNSIEKVYSDIKDEIFSIVKKSKSQTLESLFYIYETIFSEFKSEEKLNSNSYKSKLQKIKEALNYSHTTIQSFKEESKSSFASKSSISTENLSFIQISDLKNIMQDCCHILRRGFKDFSNNYNLDCTNEHQFLTSVINQMKIIFSLNTDHPIKCSLDIIKFGFQVVFYSLVPFNSKSDSFAKELIDVVKEAVKKLLRSGKPSAENSLILKEIEEFLFNLLGISTNICLYRDILIKK